MAFKSLPKRLVKTQEHRQIVADYDIANTALEFPMRKWGILTYSKADQEAKQCKQPVDIWERGQQTKDTNKESKEEDNDLSSKFVSQYSSNESTHDPANKD